MLHLKKRPKSLTTQQWWAEVGLICNPAPPEAEIPAGEMRAFIDQAVGEAEQQDIAGKEVTPWVLARIVKLTEGRSLRTNIALVKSNARLAGEIAVCAADSGSLL